MRVDPSGPRGASSCDVAPPPSATGATATETSGGGAAATADVPPPTTSDDSNIRHMLDHVLTVQAAQGQIFVDVVEFQNVGRHAVGQRGAGCGRSAIGENCSLF